NPIPPLHQCERSSAPANLTVLKQQARQMPKASKTVPATTDTFPRFFSFGNTLCHELAMSSDKANWLWVRLAAKPYACLKAGTSRRSITTSENKVYSQMAQNKPVDRGYSGFLKQSALDSIAMRPFRRICCSALLFWSIQLMFGQAQET